MLEYRCSGQDGECLSTFSSDNIADGAVVLPAGWSRSEAVDRGFRCSWCNLPLRPPCSSYELLDTTEAVWRGVRSLSGRQWSTFWSYTRRLLTMQIPFEWRIDGDVRYTEQVIPAFGDTMEAVRVVDLVQARMEQGPVTLSIRFLVGKRNG